MSGRYCFSVDGGESYREDDVHGTRSEAHAAAVATDCLHDGETIRTGVPFPVSSIELANSAIDGDAITDRLAEVANELVGEAAGSWPDFAGNAPGFQEMLGEMSKLLAAYLNSYDKPAFYRVEEIEEHTHAETTAVREGLTDP